MPESGGFSGTFSGQWQEGHGKSAFNLQSECLPVLAHHTHSPDRGGAQFVIRLLGLADAGSAHRSSRSQTRSFNVAEVVGDLTNGGERRYLDREIVVSWSRSRKLVPDV